MGLSSNRENRGNRVDAQKTKAREDLINFKRFKLKRDLFLIHGWGDEANVCWTRPYTEAGKKRAKGWKYTFKDWAEDKIINHKKKVHYLKLVKNEEHIDITTDRWGKLHVALYKNNEYDATYFYVSFFDFAELLKDKIIERRETSEIDVLCHSMGGLDAITAIALDPAYSGTCPHQFR
jgi:hypothetical protein